MAESILVDLQLPGGRCRRPHGAEDRPDPMTKEDEMFDPETEPLPAWMVPPAGPSGVVLDAATYEALKASAALAVEEDEPLPDWMCRGTPWTPLVGVACA